jgi:hypothetical protein
VTHPTKPDREPWDLDAFVRHYDELAREFGGWSFDRSGPSPEQLQQWYESTAMWDSLRDFARTRFQLDQQV